MGKLMNKDYRLLEHTADMGIEACAKSCPKVLEAMAEGLRMILFGDSPVSTPIVKQVYLNDEDPVTLMVAWLNEILFCCEQNNLVPMTFRIDSLKQGELRATLSGETFDPQCHHIERQVKAVTYHQATLKETEEGWYGRVYVDL
jgi:SHS2 domain-containing protein